MPIYNKSLAPSRSTTNWRPLPLRRRFLVPLTLLILLLILLLEHILRTCTPHGCPSFASTVTTGFVYNYLPMICTVLFGLLCALVHHDCMRMEPWFQLSRREGASAENSLLLEYPYILPPAVPFIAACNGHYMVLTGATIVLISTLVLTPLTAGLFDDALLTPFTLTNSTYPSLRWDYQPSDLRWGNKIAEYSARHVYLAYTHGWLNGSLPPFTTAEYALSPWALAANNNTNNTTAADQQEEEETWTAPTTLYEVDLACEEAISTPFHVDGVGLLGYNLTSPSLPYLSYMLWDVGLINTTDKGLMDRLRNETSIAFFSASYFSKERENFQSGADYYALVDTTIVYQKKLTDAQKAIRTTTAVYIWAAAPPPISPGWNVSVVAELGKSLLPPRWAAVFCRPVYYSQNVTASVRMPAGAVVNVTRHGQRAVIPSDNDSSIVSDFFMDMNDGTTRSRQTDSQYYDSNGYLAGLGQLPQNPPANSASHLMQRFGGREGMQRVQAKSGQTMGSEVQNGFPSFALYSQTNDTLEGLFEWEKLAKMYADALKLTFAMLCTEEWVLGLAERNETVVVRREWGERGYRVSVPWARGLQAVAAVIAVLVGGLAVAGGRRRCHLDGEPGSLVAALALLHHSPEMAALMQAVEFHDMKTVRRMLRTGGKRYHLVLEEGGVGPRVEVLEGEAGTAVMLQEPEAGKEDKKGEEEHREEEAWPASRGSVVFFALFFAVVLGLVIMLYVFVGVQNGIPSPAPQESFTYKFLFSYLPTLLGLIIEPLLVSLGSHHNMLSPYRPLLRGPTKSPRSLDLDLDKSPPHFQLLRALRARDLALALLSAAILLSNVLAVSLSALFSPSSREVAANTMIAAPPAPAPIGFVEAEIWEAHYTLYALLTADIASPNWTTPEYYVLPFTLPADSDDLATATAPTTALGMAPTCVPVAPERVTTTCLLGGTVVPCLSNMPDITGGVLTVDDPCWPPANRTSAIWSFPAGDAFVHSDACPHTFFAAWMELPADAANPGQYLPRLDSLVLKCTAAPPTAVRVEATVDAEGNVLRLEEDPQQEEEEEAADDAGFMVSSFLNATAAVGAVNTGAVGLAWFNMHLSLLYPAVTAVRGPGGNLSYVPDATAVAGPFEDVVRRVYAMGMRLHAKGGGDGEMEGQQAQAQAQVMGAVARRREMVQVGSAMLALSAGLVLFIGGVVAGVCWRGLQRTRGEVAHAPKSLVAVWAAVYACAEAKRTCGEVSGGSVWERVKKVEALGRRYRYGRFVEGGKGRVGVFVCGEGGGDVPIDI